jgi:hypothetical protein
MPSLGAPPVEGLELGPDEPAAPAFGSRADELGLADRNPP